MTPRPLFATKIAPKSFSKNTYFFRFAKLGMKKSGVFGV